MIFEIDFYIFITILIAIAWLITISFILFYALVFLRISYKINTKKRLLKIFCIYFIFASYLTYIFYSRLLNQNRSINVPEYFKVIKNILLLITPQDLIILLLFFVFTIVFCLLLLINFFYRLKFYAVVLFIYFYQYVKFRRFFGFLLDLEINYKFYLVRRVKIFTKNKKIYALAFSIWPKGINFLEKLCFFCLIPFLLIFDLYFNHGIITKVFIVFPWFLIYSVLRTSYLLYLSLYCDENIDLTYKLYGFKSKKK